MDAAWQNTGSKIGWFSQQYRWGAQGFGVSDRTTTSTRT
jgi:hypothetical protein